MTTTDYLINAVFVAVVLFQARERRVDLRAFLIPLAVVVFVAQHYVTTIPTAGNDLVLVGALTAVGIGLGVLCGFATHVRLGPGGAVLARVGWLAGVLLIAGICARMAFVFAVTHGARQAIVDFSVTFHLGSAAWPVALVSMALCEITARLVTVQVRGHRLAAGAAALGAPA